MSTFSILVFVANVCLLVSTISGQESETVKKVTAILQQCNKTNPLEPKFQEMVNAKGEIDENEPFTYNPKCFFHCFATTFGFLDKDGNFDRNIAIHMLKEFAPQMTDIDVIFDSCLAINNVVNDMCDRMYFMVRCTMIEEFKTYGSMVLVNF